MESILNILLVDDHKLFREGMRYVLEAGLGDEVNGLAQFIIYEAANCEAAIKCARQHPELDMVLMDLNLPDCQGLSGLQSFIRQFPVLPVVVLSASTQRSDITRSLEVGAMGFIPKDSSSSAVVNAIRLVLTGNIYVPPVLLDQDNLLAPLGGAGRLSPRAIARWSGSHCRRWRGQRCR